MNLELICLFFMAHSAAKSIFLTGAFWTISSTVGYNERLLNSIVGLYSCAPCAGDLWASLESPGHEFGVDLPLFHGSQCGQVDFFDWGILDHFEHCRL